MFDILIDIDKIYACQMSLIINRGNAETKMWQLAKIPITLEILGMFWKVQIDTEQNLTSGLAKC